MASRVVAKRVYEVYFSLEEKAMRKKLLLLCVVLSLCLLTAVTGCKPREPRPEPYVPSTDASFTVLSVNQEEVAEG